MSLKTRLTERFDLEHPIVSAPMAFAAGGVLAAAVSNAGGLGLIGGGYGDADWLEDQFKAAGNTGVGCGFITWSMAENPALLTLVLGHSPKALFLSFGDPMPFAAEIAAAGVPLMCQVQTLRDAKRAVEAGAEVIIAQGAEAGGHGEARGTMSFVPEVADYLSKNAADVLLLAAGGIADGRGLAAALTLGADGVLVGSRFWAASEALVHPNHWQAVVGGTGDDTLQTGTVDIVRSRDWPERYKVRVMKNSFTDKWHGQEDALRSNPEIHEAWGKAMAEGNPEIANPVIGQATGLIKSVQTASEIIEEMVSGAQITLAKLT